MMNSEKYISFPPLFIPKRKFQPSSKSSFKLSETKDSPLLTLTLTLPLLKVILTSHSPLMWAVLNDMTV